MHQQAVALPARPADAAIPPSRHLRLYSSMAHTAASEDSTLIEAVQQDAAKKALTAIASRLSQVAQAQGDARQLRGAGALLREAVPDLELAAAQGAPSFSGIGDTLPADLVIRVADTARVLSAVDESPVAAALRSGIKDPVRLAESVRNAMQAVLDSARQAATVDPSSGWGHYRRLQRFGRSPACGSVA